MEQWKYFSELLLCSKIFYTIFQGLFKDLIRQPYLLKLPVDVLPRKKKKNGLLWRGHRGNNHHDSEDDKGSNVMICGLIGRIWQKHWLWKSAEESQMSSFSHKENKSKIISIFPAVPSSDAAHSISTFEALQIVNKCHEMVLFLVKF